MVGAVRANLDVIQVHGACAQAVQLNAAMMVVAKCADVFGAQSEFRARDHRAGHLAAGAQNFAVKRSFAAICGEALEQDQRVSGVQTHADYIEGLHSWTRRLFLPGRHLVQVNEVPVNVGVFVH